MIQSGLILQAQQFLNKNYQHLDKYPVIAEDGKLHLSNMVAVTFALQSELKIAKPSGAIGEQTLSNADSVLKNLTNVPVKTLDIVRCALIFKGYFPNDLNKEYGMRDDIVERAFSDHLGINPENFSRAKWIGALFKPVYIGLDNFQKGSQQVLKVQQWLNVVYGGNASTSYIVPNGVRDAETMFILRDYYYEQVGISSVANLGVWNAKVRVAFTDEKYQISKDKNQAKDLVLVAQAALTLLGFPPDNLNGEFDKSTQKQLREFQKFVAIEETGEVDSGTWYSLLFPSGDPNRVGNACDTVTAVDEQKAQTLKDAKVKFVGRYLAGKAISDTLPKVLQSGEKEIITNHGMKVYPIYQLVGDSIKYFDYERGLVAGKDAHNRAKTFKFGSGEIIYFAVDFDPNPDDVQGAIIPYFQGIKDALSQENSTFKVGVYGTHLVCHMVSDAIDASASFTASLSNDYHGNAGIPLPKNWTIQQGPATTLGEGDGAIQVDVNYSSPRA
ncbi:MAG: DUF1906 domain-containing protein [Micrococcaceae bacterium]